MRFKLRTMFLIVAACGVPLGWLGTQIEDVRRRRAACIEIEANGCSLHYVDGPAAWHRTVLLHWFGGDVGGPVSEINLEDRLAGSESLSALQHLPEVTTIRCYGPKFSDQDVATLATLPNLQELHLVGVNVTGRLGSLLDSAQGLKRLTLESVKNADDILRGIDVVGGLTTLRLKHTDITSRGLGSLRHLAKLTALSIEPATDVDDQGLLNIVGILSLQDLQLSESAISDSGGKRLCNLSSLRSLVLDQCGVGDRTAHAISSLPRLERLSLCRTRVSDAGVRRLAAIAALRELWLSGTQVTDAGIQFLERCQSLERLEVDDTQLTDHVMPSLCRMRNLQWLNLGGTGITDVGMAQLAKATQVRFLFLRNTSTSDATLRELEKLSQLEVVAVGSAATDAGMRRLEHALPRCWVMML